MPRASVLPALAPLRARWLLWVLDALFAFNLRSFRSMIERS
jgi:hypothetical protein